MSSENRDDQQPTKDGPPAPDAKMSTTSDGDLVVESNWDEVVESFDDMALKGELLRGIYAYGFEKPSAIQQRGIMPILASHDTIAQAQSGTGKTATFSISALQLLDGKNKHTQALILAPTRELAQQIQKVVRALGDYLKVTSHACVGGTLVRDDIRTLQNGVQIVVGTPGRVYDMINRRVLSLEDVKIFILDEADEMLSRGFKDQVCYANAMQSFRRLSYCRQRGISLCSTLDFCFFCVFFCVLLPTSHPMTCSSSPDHDRAYLCVWTDLRCFPAPPQKRSSLPLQRHDAL